MTKLTTSVRRAGRGTLWITAGEGLRTIAELGTTVVAAWVLVPHDLGLLGIVLLLITMLDAFSRSGFEQALIQSPDDVHEYLDVAWTWHMLRALAISGAMLLAAPLLSRWYSEPALLPLIAVSTLQVLLQGVQNTGAILFNRDLHFYYVFLASGARAIAHAAVGVTAVLLLRNVWGLLIGQIAGMAVATGATYVLHPHRPCFRWDRARLRRLISYGRWITGLSAVTFLITSGDAAFVSKALGTAPLGVYQMAFRLSNLPATKITHVLSAVAFPLYCRLQATPDHLRRVFLSILRSTLLLSGLISAAIWITVPVIIDHVIGTKWSAVLPLTRILVIAAFVRSFVALAGPLFQAMNEPRMDLAMNLPRLISFVLLVGPLSALWGLTGVCVAVLVSICATLPVWFRGLHRILRLSARDVARAVAMPVGVSVGLVAAASGSRAAALCAVSQPNAGLVVGVLAWGLAVWVIGRLTSWRLTTELSRVVQLTGTRDLG